MSLLGLAGYGSDHSDAEEAATDEVTAKRLPTEVAVGQRTGGDLREAGAPAEDGAKQDSSELADGEDEVDSSARVSRPVARAKSFDEPAPPGAGTSRDGAKEPAPFFMPLPSPLVRLDNAGVSSSPYVDHGSTQDDEDSGVQEEGVEEDGGEAEDEDSDIIKPEYRDMLPPEPQGQADAQLQAKIAKYLDQMQGDFTKSIKAKKDYGNPAILAKICDHCNLDAKGTNYPEDRMVHPSVYDTKDFYDALMIRKPKRPEKPQPPPTAAAPTQIRTTSATAVAKSATEAGGVATAGVTVATTTTSTRKRTNKWGNVATPDVSQMSSASAARPLPSSMVEAASNAAAQAAARAAGASGAGAAARGQAAVLKTQELLKAHQAQDAQQRAEAIARVQMITSRLSRSDKPAQDSGNDQPPKKPRLT